MTSPVHLLAARDRRTGPPRGYCRGCYRAIGEKLAENGQCGYCITCWRWIVRYPDRLLEDTPNGPARVEPQARMIVNGYGWRRHAACRHAPYQLFDAPEMPNQYVPEGVQETARSYCARCPVRRQCAAEADAHEYEGLYGGVLRVLRVKGRGNSWISCFDLLADPVRTYRFGDSTQGGAA